MVPNMRQNMVPMRSPEPSGAVLTKITQLRGRKLALDRLILSLEKYASMMEASQRRKGPLRSLTATANGGARNRGTAMPHAGAA